MLDIEVDSNIGTSFVPGSETLDKPAAALRDAHERLSAHRTRVDTDPFTSPIRLMALDLVEVNPTLDSQNQTAILAVELALSAFGQGII